MRIHKAARAAANFDLILKLWAYGPHRDPRYLVANLFGDRASLRLASEVMAQLDRARMQELAARYPHEKGNPGANKYLSVGAPLIRAAFNSHMLKLDGQQAKLRVLDIGTGAGFFPFTASYPGHDVEAVDVDEEDLYRETTSLLGISRTIHRVTLETPLPEFAHRFDLITAFQLLFDRDQQLPEGIWGVQEWRQFLQILRADYLTECGSVFIGLNSGIENELLQALDAYFQSLGCDRLQNGYHITFAQLA